MRFIRGNLGYVNLDHVALIRLVDNYTCVLVDARGAEIDNTRLDFVLAVIDPEALRDKRREEREAADAAHEVLVFHGWNAERESGEQPKAPAWMRVVEPSA